MINEKVHERIKKLRKLMTDNQIRFYLIPTSDFHQTEVVGSYFKPESICRDLPVRKALF